MDGEITLLEQFYDAEYEKDRSAFIPIAEKYANDHNGVSCKSRKDDERDEWNKKWNTNFHSKMDELSMCLFNAKKEQQHDHL